MDQKLKKAEVLKADHLRMARSGLDLTVRELAVLSDMNKATIVRAEAGLSVRPKSLDSIREALEARGARFFEFNTPGNVLVGIEKVDLTN